MKICLTIAILLSQHVAWIDNRVAGSEEVAGYAAMETSDKRPNIVWLVSEDNSAEWLRIYSSHGAAMPNIERLANQGLVFNNAFSCGVVCSVARSTIISGCYAPRTGTQYHRRLASVPMPQGLQMFPYYLRQAGYFTTNCSKEDYNFSAEAKRGVWDQSGKTASYRNRLNDVQPFFHVQNYSETHEGQLHFPERDIFKNNDPTNSPVKLFSYHPDTKTFRYTYTRYLERHAKLDQEIGKFLRQLEDDGLMDDTFIFYYGDHGGVLPRGKGYAYNNGLHVPMVVYVPRNFRDLAPVRIGNRIDGFVEFVDLSATVLNLAGAEVPKGIDGRPFLGDGISLDELNSRDTAFGYADRFDEKYDLVRTLRKGRFTYMRNYQPFNFDGLHNNYRYRMAAYRNWRELFEAGKLNSVQRQFFLPRSPECLYDLDNDPDEVNNLAANPKFEQKLFELRTILRNQVTSMPDLSFIPEPVFIREGIIDPVGYGKNMKGEIKQLVEIADLALLPFSDARTKIAEALKSEKRWERYWGLIVCSSFGKKADSFYEVASEMANNDVEYLVQMRAAEFLGLTEQLDPRPKFMEILNKVTDENEALLILNSVALLEDSKPGYDFDLTSFGSAKWATGKKNPNKRRLQYFNR